jgi:hypothetical protein
VNKKHAGVFIGPDLVPATHAAGDDEFDALIACAFKTTKDMPASLKSSAQFLCSKRA